MVMKSALNREISISNILNTTTDNCTLINTFLVKRTKIYPPKNKKFGFYILPCRKGNMGFTAGKPSTICVAYGKPLKRINRSPMINHLTGVFHGL